MPKAQHPKAASFVRQNLFAGVTTFADFEARIVALPDERSRGDAFEVFAEAYLATQRKHDAANVWPLASVPTHTLKALGLAGQDYGVDGVFKTLLGHFNAYQVKFRTNRPALTWRELSTFMGLADSPHIRSRVLLTNCDELPSVLNERQGFFCIRGSDLDRLEAGDFRAIEAWLADAAFIAPKKQPLLHQTEALDALLPALETDDRVSAIMACGTGKTLVALWVAERRQASRILVLVPSLALLRQILHEWLRETSLPSLAYLCVCSDPTVKDGVDAIATAQSDLDFQVSTDAASVRDFLDAPFAGAKIVFSTYQSARVIGAALKPGEMFDLAVFDEAHKTAGREGRNYAYALEDSNLPIRKRLFLTATPRHYNPQKRNSEGDAQLVFSMDRPEVYGPQAFRLTFAEAARRGIICGYKVIISVITSEMVTNDLLSRGEVTVNGDAVRARQVANQLALRDAIEKYGAKKIFTFHSTVKSAASFVADGAEGVRTHLADVATDVRRLTSSSKRDGQRRNESQSLVTSAATSEFQTFHVNGTMPTARREREMRDFRAAPRAVMSNARCLTEGVDVPAVDMVAFLSPRRSRVDIVQATGRAMRRAPNKTTGYVLVPLYLEQAAGETIEQAVSRAKFDDVWDVLQSLQEQDEVLAEIIREMREERGRTKEFNDARFRERVEICGPYVALITLRKAITTTCVEVLAGRWEERFGELMAYKQRFGDCNVPVGWPEGRKLSGWVRQQRREEKAGVLSKIRFQRLDEARFVWDAHDAVWEEMLSVLEQFKRENGHCNVPDKWAENLRLSMWVGNQRQFRKKGLLNTVRIARLNDLGFVWNSIDAFWEKMFAALAEYRRIHGDCVVPHQWPKNPQLYTWVVSQRRRKTAGRLSEDRVQLLNKLGFVWNPISAGWDDMFIALVEYKSKHGNCNVPDKWPKNPRLAKWVSIQRQFKKLCKLNAPRVCRLESIGFIWDAIDAVWEEMFTALLDYQRKHGDLNVPRGWPADPRLGGWLTSQRQLRKSGKLNEARARRLEEIGFAWNAIDASWETMFTALVRYRSQRGDCDVPEGWQDDPQLARWVAGQRRLKRRGKMSNARLARLDEIGFVWKPHEAFWEKMFGELKGYLRTHGDCRVPSRWIQNPRLPRWVSSQRRLKAAHKLTEERVRRLDKIGFVWELDHGTWDEMFGALADYNREHGDCDVPYKWTENTRLYNWAVKQRRLRKTGKLSKEQCDRLDRLGFVWHSHIGVWEKMFMALVEYKRGHGNCKVPIRWSENPQLAAWVSVQRQLKKQAKLDQSRERRLGKIGFTWNPFEQDWDEMFSALAEYRRAQGDCKVPDKWRENSKLGGWVSRQRTARRGGYLSEDRIQQLNGIGFHWQL